MNRTASLADLRKPNRHFGGMVETATLAVSAILAVTDQTNNGSAILAVPKTRQFGGRCDGGLMMARCVEFVGDEEVPWGENQGTRREEMYVSESRFGRSVQTRRQYQSSTQLYHIESSRHCLGAN